MNPFRTAIFTALFCLLGVGASPEQVMVSIPGGIFTPQYVVGGKNAKVLPFRIAAYSVTNAQYLEFVRANPQWRRSKVKRVFAESDYLKHWDSDLSFDPKLANSPVTYVSWFAARAYCQAQGARLPSQDEWEFAARADETSKDASKSKKFQQRILDWYSRPNPPRPAPIGSTFKNVYGVSDMHGLVWEWVNDFNTILLTGESRQDGELNRELFCAAGVTGSTDPGDYAAYMRYAFRSSLKSNYCLANLGFRCAASGAGR